MKVLKHRFSIFLSAWVPMTTASMNLVDLSRFTSPKQPLNISVIGAGNLCHVFAGLLGARQEEFHVRILSRKAKQIANNMIEKGVKVKMASKEDGKEYYVTGRVLAVSDNPEDVIPEADIIIITVPSHGRPAVMKLIAPHIAKNRIVYCGVIPGMGGFDFIARSICAHYQLNNCVLYGLKDVPYMCSHTVPGSSVTMLGPKTNIYLALDQYNQQHATVLQSLLTRLTNIPTVILPSFLVITLTPGNPIMHPSIMYGMFGPYSQWDGKSLEEKPLFYEEVSELSSYFLAKADEEVQCIKRALEQASGVDLEAVWPLRLNLKKVYGPIVEDNRTLMLAMRTNHAYKTIRTPLKQVPGGFTIDEEHRFFLEDIPYGLVILRDLADICELKTSMIDELIVWAQQLMGKEYLVQGELKGKDMKETGAPTIWGIKSIKQLTQGAFIRNQKSEL